MINTVMAKADQMVLVIEVQHSIKRSGRVKLAKLETIKSERGRSPQKERRPAAKSVETRDGKKKRGESEMSLEYGGPKHTVILPFSASP